MTITTLNNLSADWVALLWKASWQGGAALLLILVVSRAFRRFPAHVQCWLWRLAFLKLLIAGIAIVSVELPWLPPEKTKSAEMAPITVAEWPAPATDVVTEEIPARLSAMTTPGAISDGGAAASLESVSRFSRSSWLFIAWIVGVVACLVNLMRQWVLVRKMISTLPSGTNEGVRVGLVENCRRMGVTGEPDLRVSNDSGSPCLIGVIRPVIVLPSTVLESCSAEALNAALLHELAHIKRRDLLWNWLPALAEVAFFFHPLVWLARREWRLAQEIATDELAVSISRVDASRYAGCLVELVAKCRATTFRPHLAVGVSETYSQLSRRMTAMLTFQKTTTRRRVAAGVVVLAVAVCGIVPWKLTAREALAQPESIETPSQRTATAQKSDQPTESQEAALAAVEKLGGTIQRDENRPERPVISISFLKNSKVADADLRYLKSFPRLLELTVSHPDISDAGLEHLKGLASLKALFIDKTRVTNEGLAHLKGLTGLVILELGNVRINDEGLVHLQGLINLDLLQLANTRITDKGLAYLKGMSRLQTLNLDGTRITDAGLEHLAGLTSLRDLRLRETAISDAGLVHLRGLTRLDTLVLNSTKVTGEGLVQLDELPNLRSLWLADSRITDAGLEHLQGLTRLSTLVLRKTHVTDKGLEYVNRLFGLQTLDLGNTKVTDAGLENLNGLTNLRTLNLDSNTKVTDAGVQKLQTALPECTIPWGRSKKRDELLEGALKAHAPAAQVVPAKTVDELIEEFSSAEYFWQQGDVARKLVALGDKRIIPRMEKLLDTEDRRRRCNVGLVLAGLGDRRGLAILIGELEDKKPRPTDLKRSDNKPDPESQTSQDRYYAALLLGQLGKNEAVPALIEATKDKTINYQAAVSLGEIGDKSAIPALRRMASDFPDQRLWAGYGLAALGESEGFDILMNVALSGPNWTDRRHAAEALGKIGNPKSVPTLTKALRDEHANVRVSAAVALGQIGDPGALPALTEALSDPETTQVNAPTSVAVEARKAIDAIKGKKNEGKP